MSEKRTDKENWKNPIDPDKVTENPGTLPYAHTVGGAVVKPTEKGVIRSRSLSAMEQQTDMQLDQIKQQIELLAKQARKIQMRKELSERIYAASISFTPLVNHIYHLYQNKDEEYVLSMIGPDEWGRKRGYAKFINSVRLLADHTWHIEA